MGITMGVLGMFGFLLVAVTIRLGLHEFCYRFDGGEDLPPRRKIYEQVLVSTVCADPHRQET